MIAFIADLHLQRENPTTLRHATEFLRWAKGRCSQLYILGDLFEYWLGDDYPLPGLEEFQQELKNLGRSPCTVTLMHGNRDFLLGEAFIQEVGATLERADTLRISLGQKNVLLMHGDTLCTDDTDYISARLLLRSNTWQQQFCALPLEQRLKRAQDLRQQSKSSSASKQAHIMDVNIETVNAVVRQFNTDILIHGHTHRPHWHKSSNLDRVVLGDWKTDGAYIAVYDNQKLSLKHWPFSQ